MGNLSAFEKQFSLVKLIWKDNRRIHANTIYLYKLRILHYVDYCEQRGLDPYDELTLQGVTRFSQWYARTRTINPQLAFKNIRGALHSWAFALQAVGITIPPWSIKKPIQPRSVLLREFAQHLSTDRGNPDTTIHKKLRHIVLFKQFLSQRKQRLVRCRLKHIDDFILHIHKDYAIKTLADICCSVRGFVRFLVMTGRIPSDFSSSILIPFVLSSTKPHRTLPWSSIQQILRAVDRRSVCGKRDYCLLLMMATYGLGAGEIIQLTLDDLNWRTNTLHVVRPKTKSEFYLPLLPDVSNALASYLQYSRPRHTPSRHVFVTFRAPYKSLACSVTIRHILHTWAKRAGVDTEHLGTHLLRHTHACRQLELGTDPKLIGDILGHQNPASTSAYLRVATERLRNLSLSVPRL